MWLCKVRKGYLYQLAYHNNSNSYLIQSEIISFLKKGFFIIEDDFDELKYIDVMHRILRYRNDAFGLTIVPTQQCNFSCIYCYQYKHMRQIKKDIQEKIINFVHNRLNNIRSLGVTWYGGEPLIALQVIENLSLQFINLCTKLKIDYSAGMISNGWYLTKNVANILKKLNIKNVQITLDGPPEVHNLRRPTLAGTPTFDRILNNIQEASDVLRIIVRINIDKKNANKAIKLLNILKNQNLLRKIDVYFGRVSPDTPLCKDIERNCYSLSEFSKIETQLYEQALEYGFKIVPYPQPMINQCGAVQPNSFVVDPTGDLHKCWTTIGMSSEYVGHVNQNSISMTPKLIQWLSWDPLKEGKCLKCEILPLCMGGCPYRSLQKGRDCIPLKRNIRKLLLLYYLQNQIRGDES